MNAEKDEVAAQEILGKMLELFPIRPTSREPAQVTPWLLLGSASHGEDVDLLLRLNISTVINCAEGDVSLKHYQRLRDAGISIIGFSSSDAADYPLLERHLPTVLEIVRSKKEEGQRCLLHCQAGVNRSGALAIACLVEESGLPLVEAAARVNKARGRVCTNKGFQRQLVQEAVRRGWALL